MGHSESWVGVHKLERYPLIPSLKHTKNWVQEQTIDPSIDPDHLCLTEKGKNQTEEKSNNWIILMKIPGLDTCQIITKIIIPKINFWDLKIAILEMFLRRDREDLTQLSFHLVGILLPNFSNPNPSSKNLITGETRILRVARVWSSIFAITRSIWSPNTNKNHFQKKDGRAMVQVHLKWGLYPTPGELSYLVIEVI